MGCVDDIFVKRYYKKQVNRASHIVFSLVSQSYFIEDEEEGCLILASSQRKLHRYINFQNAYVKN